AIRPGGGEVWHARFDGANPSVTTSAPWIGGAVAALTPARDALVLTSAQTASPPYAHTFTPLAPHGERRGHREVGGVADPLRALLAPSAGLAAAPDGGRVAAGGRLSACASPRTLSGAASAAFGATVATGWGVVAVGAPDAPGPGGQAAAGEVHLFMPWGDDP